MPRTTEEIKKDLMEKLAERDELDDEINALRTELTQSGPMGWVVLTSPPDPSGNGSTTTIHPIKNRVLFLANHGVRLLAFQQSPKGIQLEVRQHMEDADDFLKVQELSFGQGVEFETRNGDAELADDENEGHEKEDQERAAGYTVSFFATREAAEANKFEARKPWC